MTATRTPGVPVIENDELVSTNPATGVVVGRFPVASPDDIAGAILYFAGPSSDYVTGQILSVSGGLTMAG